MTLLEKAKLESEEKRIKFSEDGLPSGCPYKYGYEEYHSCSGVECIDCWNREMPNTEPKEEIFDCADGYDKGLNDAWELARKLNRLETSEIAIIFERPYAEDVLDNYTPQEALAKLKAYENSKIEVGDVVFCSSVAEDDNDTEKKDNYGVVTGIYRDHYEILMKNGDATGFKKETCKKTGKHIDIQSILEQIGE